MASLAKTVKRNASAKMALDVIMKQETADANLDGEESDATKVS